MTKTFIVKQHNKTGALIEVQYLIALAMKTFYLDKRPIEIQPFLLVNWKN